MRLRDNFNHYKLLSTSAAPTNYFSPMESQYAGPGQFSAPATPGRIPPSAPFKMDYTGIVILSQVGQYTEKKNFFFRSRQQQTGKDAYSYLFEKQVKGGKPGEKELDVGKAALIGIPALTYAIRCF
jgi:hypothetical protein